MKKLIFWSGVLWLLSKGKPSLANENPQAKPRINP